MGYKRVVKKIFVLIPFLVLFFVNAHAHHIALISIPKCGTHLLKKLLLKMIDSEAYIEPQKVFLYDETSIQDFFSKSALLSSHALHTEENVEKIANLAIKKIFIYRDPRDQIISAAFWMKKNRNIWRLFEKAPMSRIIDELIYGGGSIWSYIFSCRIPWQDLYGIASFYNYYLPWRFELNVYTTTFEKLVGPQGGGSQELQYQEIFAIANFLGISITFEEVQALAAELFGGTQTFREGKIGSWKKYFSQTHKEAFKNVAGQLLIDLGYERDINW